MDKLADGWTIYIWLVAGAAIVVTAVFMILWAYKNDQFDEDIKYVVFDENDQDKMSPEEYKKSVEVNKAQEEKRKEFLAKKAAEKRSLNA